MVYILYYIIISRFENWTHEIGTMNFIEIGPMKLFYL
jgi:hypothetical protein